MAKVLAVLCSGRKSGYTAGLLQAAADAAQDAGDVEIDLVRLHDYKFGPCTSCFACVRDEKHRCVLPDDMGRKGKGKLFQKLLSANGIIIGDPVHLWGASAMCHTFFERCYPFLWTDELNGLPFMSISCASNQGMQHVACSSLCRWAFTQSMRYVGQLPAHVSYYDSAIEQAKVMGKRLAEAALTDAQGRQAFANDTERLMAYSGKPWNPIEHYLWNLGHGTYRWEDSLPERALRQGTIKKPEAVELLKKASELLRQALSQRQLHNMEKACELLVEASAYWTHATWKEFLEEQVIAAQQPEAYRPIPDTETMQVGEPLPTWWPAGRNKVLAYVDGASRGNPGPAAVGVVLQDAQGKMIEGIGKPLGKATNNVAEYQALIVALQRAKELGADAISIRADSKLLVQQTKGEYKVKSPNLRPLAQEVQKLLAQFDDWAIVHVPRGKNAAADELANRALDTGKAFVERP